MSIIGMKNQMKIVIGRYLLIAKARIENDAHVGPSAETPERFSGAFQCLASFVDADVFENVEEPSWKLLENIFGENLYVHRQKYTGI